MTPEGNYIVGLAHAFLSSGKTEFHARAELDGARLLELMSRGLVTSSLGPLALEDPRSNRFKKPLETRLRVLDDWCVRLWIEVTRICRVLHDANLEYLLLKGPALALSVYPKPSQRSSSDVDILVAGEDIEPACDALKSIGYRLDWPDASLAYVTDTTASPESEYIEQIRNVDVLLHECYFPDGWEDKAELTGHSCITPVAQVAAAADVGLLVLVHINPMSEDDDPLGVEAAREIFPAIEIGEDGTTIEF